LKRNVTFTNIYYKPLKQKVIFTRIILLENIFQFYARLIDFFTFRPVTGIKSN